MRRNIVSVFLAISLLANFFLAWGMFNRYRANENTAVEYYTTIALISRAESLLSQVLRDSSSRGSDIKIQESNLFQAYTLTTNIQLSVEHYRNKFSNKGIAVQNLITLLQDDSFYLMIETGNLIKGIPSNTDKIISVDKDLLYLKKTLPSSYDEGNTTKIREAFSKIRHQ